MISVPGANTANRRQGLGDGVQGQVHGDAEPADERGSGRIESGLDETAGQRSSFEIKRDEADGARRRDPRGGKTRALPFLGQRVIDLEDPDLARQFGAVGERVKAGAEDHILGDAAPHAMGEPVFCVAASARNLRSGASKDDVRAMGAVVTDELIGPIAEQCRRHGVDEDPGVIVDDQMGSAGSGGGECGIARLVKICHT